MEVQLRGLRLLEGLPSATGLDLEFEVYAMLSGVGAATLIASLAAVFPASFDFDSAIIM